MSLPRVLFLVRRAGPYHLARFEAAGRQVALTVVETRPGSNEYPWEEQIGGSSFRLDAFQRAPVPEDGLKGERLRAEVVRAFEEHAPDVIATAGWADKEYHAALLEAKHRGVPAVVMSDSTEQDEPRSLPKEALKRLLLKNYSAAIVAGKRSRAYIQRLGFRDDQLFAPWDVVDNDFFSSNTAAERVGGKSNGDDSRLQWLCVARFIPKKNLERLLSCYARYVRETGDTRPLALLGSGPLEAALRKMVSALGLGERVRFSGFVQYDALPREYARSLALILPSLSDQWGLVVNEAMAAGLPVLVSDRCGCAPDLVENGCNGFTFSPESEEELVGALRKLGALNPQQRRAFGETSARYVRHYSPEAFATALALSSQKALSSRSRGNAVSNLLLSLVAKRTS